MPSRSKCNRLGSGADEEEEGIVAVSSDPDEEERGAEADDGDDDDYVGESSDAGEVDEAEEEGDGDNGDGGRRFRGGRRGGDRSGEEIAERECPRQDEFIFLLSSKAGSCGLNLVGGNRLVLFDPDWNPANDKQAAARVWRDGQKKRVYIYRFLSTGTIEEKVYQRQMSKEGLQKVIQQEQADNKMQESFLSTEDLRDLFTFHEQVRSEIHENLKCGRCNKDGCMLVDGNGFDSAATGHNKVSTSGGQDYIDIGGFGEISGCVQKMNSSNQQIGRPSEEDLGSWGHHSDPSTVPDTILQCSAGDEVSFVFTNQVDGKLVPVESMTRLTTHQPNGVTTSGEKGVGKINSPNKPGRQSLLGKNLKMMGFNLKNSSLKCPTKSRRTSPICLQGLNKTNPSSDHQPQTKKLHVASDMSDDDFA